MFKVPRPKLCSSLGLAAALVFTSVGVRSALAADPLETGLRTYLEERDYLAARVVLKKLAKKPLVPSENYRIQELIFRNPQVGSDLILAWNKRILGGAKALADEKESQINRLLASGDNDLNSRNFVAAIDTFQKAARLLKDRRDQSRTTQGAAQYLTPFVFHSLGRAFFGAGKYPEALEVYGWIDPKYSRYRQVLFEKMWAAFRAGRVDIALGAIASQRSAYFSRFLEPETYLVQIYLYKGLCRAGDLKEVLAEIEKFKHGLESGSYSATEWSRSEVEKRILLDIATRSRPYTDSEIPQSAQVSNEERKGEQRKIADFLRVRFDRQKPRLIEELTLAQAYSRIAVAPGMGSGFKPIEKFSGREALFRANLEIWPADSAEDWADEVGGHRFIGESLCQKAE